MQLRSARELRSAATPQHRANAAIELGQLGRRRDIVVGAQVEAEQPLGQRRGGRQEHDRDIAARPQQSARIEAGEARQRDIEQHELEVVLLEHPERLLAGLGEHDRVPLAAQPLRDLRVEAAARRDEQQAGGLGSRRPGARPRRRGRTCVGQRAEVARPRVPQRTCALLRHPRNDPVLRRAAGPGRAARGLLPASRALIRDYRTLHSCDLTRRSTDSPTGLHPPRNQPFDV